MACRFGVASISSGQWHRILRSGVRIHDTWPMAFFQSVLFFGMGVFLLALDWRGLKRGSLPFGSKAFLQKLTYERDRDAVRFWIAFATYLVVGVGMIVYALMLSVSAAVPLPVSR